MNDSPADIIDLFHRATAANRATPQRQGNLIVLPADPEGDVLITADLHGHRENFEAILAVADLDQNPRRHLVLQEVCHGGPQYPGKCACMSHVLLADVARLKLQYPDRVHFILSNHELAEMTDYPIVKGHRMLNLMFRSGLHEQFGEAGEAVHDALVGFLSSLPLGVRLHGDVLVTHSAPPAADRAAFDASIFERPLTCEDCAEGGPVFQLVWGRDYRPENAHAFAQQVGARVLIHGHDPCPQGCKVPNDVQIILDCCSRPASYLLIPLDRPRSHAELVAAIRHLP